MKKKLLSLLLSAAMVLCAFPVTAFATAPTESWSNSVASDFAGGMGTEEDPYEIATAEQLAKLAADVNAGTGITYQEEYFELTDDIDLSGKLWDPIGYIGSDTGWYVGFSGYFNGNNHTISGMYVDTRGEKSTGGLFGCVSADSTDPVIQNLTVEGEVYAGEALSELDYPAAGILAGDVTRSAATDYVAIKNCHVSGSVFSESDYVGGIIGSVSRLHISDSSADVKVTGQGCTGGFIGYGFTGDYQNCTASGDVNGTWSVGGFAGEMFGESYEYISLDHCLASGNATASDWRVGGFAGYLEVAKISNSVATGEVCSTLTTDSPKAGGFVGEVYRDVSVSESVVTITNSHAVGKGTVAHNEIPFGGFVGYLYQGTITDCSYDETKNDVAAVAQTGADGMLNIEKASTETVLSNICVDYYSGHQYSTELTVDKQPTCTETGSQSYHCERCGDKKDSQVIPAANHSWGEAEWKWLEDYSGAAAIFTCQNDNTHQETLQATVTSTIICEATCTKAGKKINSASVTFNGGTYTNKQEVIIAATEHKAGTEWKHNDTSHWNECVNNCGEKLNEAAHTFEWVVDKESTATKAGTKHEECTVCGYEKAAAEIPATGTTDVTNPPKPTGPNKGNPDKGNTSPQTSDNSNFALWIALLLTSGGALTAAALYGRKRKNRISKAECI